MCIRRSPDIHPVREFARRLASRLALRFAPMPSRQVLVLTNSACLLLASCLAMQDSICWSWRFYVSHSDRMDI
jgi:hypothetical protein